jgi:integrase
MLMNKVISFPNSDIKEYRQKCIFMNRAVQIVGEDGIMEKYPCIVLYEEDTDIPVYYTGLERYLCHLVKGELLNGKTLSMKAYAVCHFLNYLLRETNINVLHECTLETIRDFLKYIKVKDSGEGYNRDTWTRYRDHVIDFLIMYYTYNKDTLPFQFIGDELKTLMIIKDEKHRNKATIAHNSSLHISAPKTTHKKNRILVDGYLDLLLYEAKKYETDITLGIALEAYAGIREGEAVNVTCGRIKTLRRGFGVVSGIEIDLTDKAPYFQNWRKKTDPGTIKKYRTQKVYNDFIETIQDMYEYHIALMESKGFDTSKDAPLFVNKQGNPMTVQTYSDRIKRLFYERFMPSLKLTCEKQGTYADNAAFIEAYEIEYPGAHMFRHWFTMYLLTKAGLTSGEIMKWRGDANQESMNTYIHENADLIQLFRDSSYTFQRQILEDIL